MLRHIIKSTTIQTTGRIITILISLVTTASLTRILGVSNYGLFTLVTSVLLLIDALADFGTRTIGVREASVVKTEEEKIKIWINTVVLRKILVTCAFGLGLLLVIFYSGFEGYRWWVLIALCMSWFTSVAGDEEMILQTESRLDLKTIIDILYPAGFLVILFFFGNKLNLGWVFGGYLVSRTVSLVVGWRLIKSQVTNYKLQAISKFKITNCKINRETVLRLLRESWPMGLYLLIFTSYDRAVDATMIRHFWDDAAVAEYGLAYKIYGNLIMPAYFLVSSVLPIMSKGEEKNATKKTLGLAGLMVGVIVPTIWLLAPWIIWVLAGSGYEMSVVVLRILLLALVFSYFGHVFGFRLISKGGQKSMLWLGLAALVVNVGLNWALIPYFGIIAAAWVTVVTEAVTMSLMVWSLKRS